MVDWADTLAEIGVSVPPGKDEVSIYCPFHEDSVTSCSINTSKGVWICFAGCGAGSLYGFLMKYYNISYEEAQNRVQQNEASFNINMFDEFVEEEPEMPEIKFPFQQGSVPPWIFDRGFNKDTLRLWNCGIDIDHSLVIPIHMHTGTLVGWEIGRAHV